MIIQKQFFYVRHGQTEWNLIGKLQGCSNVPLNDTGRAQALEASLKLADAPVAAIYCSPLQRARDTAGIINQTLKCPIIELEGLRECNFGSHEGSFTHHWLRDWLLGETQNVPADVEPIVDFKARCTKAINQALEHAEPVLIVAHGGTYMPLNQSLPRDQQWNLPNCQPVRHDPPDTRDGEWKKVSL